MRAVPRLGLYPDIVRHQDARRCGYGTLERAGEPPASKTFQAFFSPACSAAVASDFGPPLATPTMAGRNTRSPIV